MSPRTVSWWEKWLPFLLAVGFQVVGGVTYAVHASDQTAQNTKDIAEMKLMLVPRPEIEQQKLDTKEELHSIESKLDILLTRKDEASK